MRNLLLSHYVIFVIINSLIEKYKSYIISITNIICYWKPGGDNKPCLFVWYPQDGAVYLATTGVRGVLHMIVAGYDNIHLNTSKSSQITR